LRQENEPAPDQSDRGAGSVFGCVTRPGPGWAAAPISRKDAKAQKITLKLLACFTSLREFAFLRESVL
jgi:hypothetical protein